MKGEWNGFRRSKLNDQYRVIYCMVAGELVVQVVDVNAHDYQKQSSKVSQQESKQKLGTQKKDKAVMSKEQKWANITPGKVCASCVNSTA